MRNTGPGIQQTGHSPASVYRIAERIISDLAKPRTSKVLDVGAGVGHFTRTLVTHFEMVLAIDYYPQDLGNRVEWRSGDLNQAWPVANSCMDIVVALEVIEHLENPRHFFREIRRVLCSGGYAVISTPNQISLASKFCLLIRDQFQHFQDTCYPAHITPILPDDLVRMAKEVNMDNIVIHYTDCGRIPFTRSNWPKMLRGKNFSDNVLLSFRYP